MSTGNRVDCLFCRIAAGEKPAVIVLEDERFVAFLDHRPLFPGHCLLIPKTHYETLADLPPHESAPLVANTQLLCSALESELGAEGTFVAIKIVSARASRTCTCTGPPAGGRTGCAAFSGRGGGIRMKTKWNVCVLPWPTQY